MAQSVRADTTEGMTPVHRKPVIRRRRRAALACALALVALSAAGCAKRSPTTTGSINAAALPTSPDALRSHAETLAARNAADPANAEIAIAYAAALRQLDQRSQAVAVLQQSALRNRDHLELLGAYGRALADVGRFQEASEVLARAHVPERPNWRVLSAQGIVADQLGEHDRARKFYGAALKIVPDEPSVMSNLGLSLALTKKLSEAEAVSRRAAADPRADQRVRQNLALVLGLQGKFAEAEQVLRRDLSAADVAINMNAIRGMVAQQNSWEQMRALDQKPANARRS